MRNAADHRPVTETVMPVDVRSMALMILAVLGVVFLLKYAQAVLTPLVLAVLISYALEPPVATLTAWRLPRPVAAAIVLFCVVGAGSVMLYQLRGEANAIVEQLPDAARRLRHTLERERAASPTAIEHVQKAATELEKAATAAAPTPPAAGVTRVQVENAPIQIRDYLLWGSVGAATAVMQIILIVFLVFFLLASGDLFRRKLVKIAGPASKRVTLQILQEIDRQIERFLMVQLLVSALVGFVTWAAFRWIGLQQAALWGLMAGIFNSIPYFGPVIVTGATSVVGFLQFGSIRMALITGAIALVITTLEGMLLTPWLTSRAARMNAVAIFVGLLFWGWVWGVWGMLLAVPMLMVVKAICDRIEELKGVGELLGE
jgi:predicted PurR-regulated permease PerM